MGGNGGGVFGLTGPSYVLNVIAGGGGGGGGGLKCGGLRWEGCGESNCE